MQNFNASRMRKQNAYLLAGYEKHVSFSVAGSRGNKGTSQHSLFHRLLAPRCYVAVH